MMDRGFRKKFLKRKTLGQSTAEYLIILILVSISSIGIMSLFGQSIRSQITNVVAAFTGSESKMIDEDTLQKTATEAAKRAKKGVTMKGIDSDEIGEFKAN